MFSVKDENYVPKCVKFTWRGLLIALCMGLFHIRFWWIGNLGFRMWAVHLVNYIPDKVPILKAARHCANAWGWYDIFTCEPPDSNVAVYIGGMQ